MVREFNLPLGEYGYWLADLVSHEGWPCYCDRGSAGPLQDVNRNGLPCVNWGGRAGDGLLLAAACDISSRLVVGGQVIQP